MEKKRQIFVALKWAWPKPGSFYLLYFFWWCFFFKPWTISRETLEGEKKPDIKMPTLSASVYSPALSLSIVSLKFKTGLNKRSALVSFISQNIKLFIVIKHEPYPCSPKCRPCPVLVLRIICFNSNNVSVFNYGPKTYRTYGSLALMKLTTR